MKNLIIIGAGGHGKVCAEIAKDMGQWDEIFFLDDSYPKNKNCLDFKIIGTTKDYHLYNKVDFFVAIGDNKVRAEFLDILIENKLKIVTLIHPTAYISKYTKVDIGTSIHQFSIINTGSVIGKGCIINTAVIVEHENLIDNYVHLSPNVSLGGQVKIGKFSWIGICATVINNVSIVENVIIGANTLVIKNINNQGVYYNKLDTTKGIKKKYE